MSTKLNAKIESIAYDVARELHCSAAEERVIAAAIREIAQPIAEERDELRDVLREMLRINALPVRDNDEAMGVIGEVLAVENQARAILAKYPRTNDPA